jgi:hypothetical protein
MTEYVVTLETGPTHTFGDADNDAMRKFLRDHPGVSIEPRGDGSVRGKVHVEADNPGDAQAEARNLVMEAMSVIGRTLDVETIQAEIADG